VIEVRELTDADVSRIGNALPLHRYDAAGTGTYLVAWDDGAPVGHVHVAWDETELGLPELQDMFVLPERRSLGIGSVLAAAAEALIRARGHDRSSLSVSEENALAQRLYERLGYARADYPAKHVQGRIRIRGGTLEVDDVLLYFTKRLA
jgi:GNAT superfamily N-acetyltransferase